jgi:hypothetical protein
LARLSQTKRFGRRRLMLLMLNVAIFMAATRRTSKSRS